MAATVGSPFCFFDTLAVFQRYGSLRLGEIFSASGGEPSKFRLAIVSKTKWRTLFVILSVSEESRLSPYGFKKNMMKVFCVVPYYLGGERVLIKRNIVIASSAICLQMAGEAIQNIKKQKRGGEELARPWW